jgi:aspartyl-tRNA(Asn)/glutamyl-tRNA(Gln) amidotransferase subunit C
MAEITQKDVAYMARLARLEVSPEETEHLVQYFGEILTSFQKLGEVDLSHVVPFGMENAEVRPLREDILSRDDRREAILEQVPLREGDYIRVPRIMEEA